MPNQQNKSAAITAITFVAGLIITVTGSLMWESTKTGVANAAGWVLFPGLVILAYGIYSLIKLWNK
jgi:hypothetical protein